MAKKTRADKSAYSQRDKDLLGIDGGQKVRRDLCGDPKSLTPEEIEALGIRLPPKAWNQWAPRKRRYDIP